MQLLFKRTYYTILVVFALSAVLCIGGVVYTWTIADRTPEGDFANLPYLNVLFGSIIVEAIAVVIIVARKGIKYLPDVETNKSEDETFAFMRSYVSNGTSTTIVSNRASILTRSKDFLELVQQEARAGKRFEVITPSAIDFAVRHPLEQAGVLFVVTGEQSPPEARFTLINADRAGAERLAIAKGTHPDHEITTFDANSGPQMIAMAKDIVRKSKLLANGQRLG